MALLTNELEILPLSNLFSIPLCIPSYQRPYKWSARSTNLLFIDTYEAFQNDLSEYRLGSIILQKDSLVNKYNIVDGQQRLTTLSIAVIVYYIQTNHYYKQIIPNYLQIRY